MTLPEALFRYSELQAEGLTCTCSNLLRATDGRYVFLVEAEPAEPLERERSSARSSSTSRRPRPKERRPVKVEYR